MSTAAGREGGGGRRTGKRGRLFVGWHGGGRKGGWSITVTRCRSNKLASPPLLSRLLRILPRV